MYPICLKTNCPKSQRLLVEFLNIYHHLSFRRMLHIEIDLTFLNRVVQKYKLCQLSWNLLFFKIILIARRVMSKSSAIRIELLTGISIKKGEVRVWMGVPYRLNVVRIISRKTTGAYSFSVKFTYTSTSNFMKF